MFCDLVGSTALSARLDPEDMWRLVASYHACISEVIGRFFDKTPAEQAVVGETPNLAARLQTLAEPGTVLICPNTRRLTGGHFDYRYLDARAAGNADGGAALDAKSPRGGKNCQADMKLGSCANLTWSRYFLYPT
jgi:class 3 adenylate cyclase